MLKRLSGAAFGHFYASTASAEMNSKPPPAIPARAGPFLSKMRD